jgi:hypothetical protein
MLSAQILEFFLTAPNASAWRFRTGLGFMKKSKPTGNCSLAVERTRLRSAQPYGNRAFRKTFPRANARLCKANLEIRFSCVNVPLRLSAQALSIPRTSADNVGKTSLMAFPEET